MGNRILLTPRFTIFLSMLELTQQLYGVDKVTDGDVDVNNLPIVRVEEGMSSDSNNKGIVGSVTMTVNMFSTTGLDQRTKLEVMLAELYNSLQREELPQNDYYNVQVASIEEPTPRRDNSTGQTLLQKTLVIRLTYTKK